ncbi:protein toll-like [Centruroides sculpturatus]|uniref:protein toll-like n=1 Tax=Centruroides sculpturatus TaxID=218467 RepID=UPI000C6D87F1|nr:protein toll-like [Centruroides sculpturatus]
MRLVIIFPFLLSLVNCCQHFWNQWGNFSCKAPIYKCRGNTFYIMNGTEMIFRWSHTNINSCISNADRCHISNKHSFVEIFNNTLSVTCSDEETIDFRVIRCLNVKHVKNLKFIDCYFSKFAFEKFASNYAIEIIVIKYTLKSKRERLKFEGGRLKLESERLNFESASFINMSSLKHLAIKNVRTFDILNLSFDGDSSLISLKITDYNFTSFLYRPFQQLKNLSELQLNDGKLKSLPEELFHGLYNLKTLDLIYNLIEFVHPFVFRHLTLLEQLNLSNNKIQSLPKELFGGLDNLKSLDLKNNFIEYLHPLVFRHLTLLEQLNLEHNLMTSFPNDLMKGLSNLTIFSISGKSSHSKYLFSKGPHNVTHLRSVLLKGLDNLTEFRASYFPSLRIEEDFFSHSMNLRKVDFSFNEFLHLPSNLLKNNKNLHIFLCRWNELSTVPNGIFDGLSKLKQISLCGNRLENIPEDTFRGLSNLEEVDLSSNRLTFLPKNTFLPTSNLRILDLSENNFSKISFEFNNKLERLDLKNAGLTEWPNLNWTKYNLTYVYAPFNHFETVKLPIYTPNRMEMDLDYCHIKTIYIDEWKYGFNRPSYKLVENPITCDGELLHFISTVQSNLEISLQIFPDVIYKNCHGEERKLLEFTQFYAIRSHCPMNCECFSENDELKVDCNGKEIEKIPEFLIENATIVDLSNNYISELSTVDYRTWGKVTRLHLSNNSLLHFPDCAFLSNVKFLWLDGNRLTELPYGLMNMIDVSAEFTVYLSRNNWTCDCLSRFTKDWLLRNKRKIADFSEISCERNSSVFSFTSIISNNQCTQIPEDNLMSTKNVSCTKSVCSEEVYNFGWKIAVAVFAFLLLFSWIMFASFVYCRKKEMSRKWQSPRKKKRFITMFTTDNFCQFECIEFKRFNK